MNKAKETIGGGVISKQEIFGAFDQKISKSSIVKRDGEYVIQGKFCVIALEAPDLWNIWICNPDDLYSGLGTKKVHNICAVLKKSHSTSAYTELTGEAYMIVRGTELILKNRLVLGIPKKREIW